MRELLNWTKERKMVQARQEIDSRGFADGYDQASYDAEKNLKLSPEVTFPSDLRTDEDKKRYQTSFMNGYKARVRQTTNPGWSFWSAFLFLFGCNLIKYKQFYYIKIY